MTNRCETVVKHINLTGHYIDHLAYVLATSHDTLTKILESTLAREKSWPSLYKVVYLLETSLVRASTGAVKTAMNAMSQIFAIFT